MDTKNTKNEMFRVYFAKLRINPSVFRFFYTHRYSLRIKKRVLACFMWDFNIQKFQSYCDK